MRCGENGTECALRHVVPALGGHCTKTRTVGAEKIPYEWYARCPSCGGADKLTVTAKGRTMLLHCQRCKVSQDKLMAKMAALLPACFRVAGAPRAKPSGITKDALIDLARRDLPGTAYRVAMLRLAGVPAAEAQQILKIPKSTYYDAMKILSRESGFSDSTAGHA